jgi:alcohol dehydrogenase class IV
MPYVIEHYDPREDKHYTARAGNPEAAEQLKKVLEHLGMKEVTVFEEIDPETLGRLNEFIKEHNITNSKNRLGNISDAIDFLIQSVNFFESVCLEGNLLDFTEEEIERMDIDPKYKEFLKKNSKKE